MKLDKRALERLMALDDDQLMRVVEKLAADSGVNLGAMNITKEDLARLRAALGGANDRDAERLTRQFGQMQMSKGQFGQANGNPSGGGRTDGNPTRGGDR